MQDEEEAGRKDGLLFLCAGVSKEISGSEQEEKMKAEIIKTLIEHPEQYEAHIKKDGSGRITERETLLEHTQRTVRYFEQIWEEKGIEDMTARFQMQIYGRMSEQAEQFWKEMITGIPVFHDLGKINPDFQRRIMNNDRMSTEAVFHCIGGRHSILSAVLYLEYFLGILKNTELDRMEKRILRRYILYHAYIIERHHSDLTDFEKFARSLEEEAGKDVITVCKKGACTAWKKDFFLDEKKINNLLKEFHRQEEISEEVGTGIYTYVKLMYSLLVASDYYATSEFISGTKISRFGNMDGIRKWIHTYEQSELMLQIRSYQKTKYPGAASELRAGSDINQLRTEMLCDAEDLLRKNAKDNLFYLEAPTGSGKSNTALDLSFQLLQMDARLKKIYYIYPFNTLVEQNLKSIEKVFGDAPDIRGQIAVVNSLVPIKTIKIEKRIEEEQECTCYYQEALLDRQFLNYPMILSTHVSLFDTMFGDTRESAFAFHQLMNSVIVLDEIQSYKNTIWGEIICFLKKFSALLNIKILIMSATLPDLDLLSEHAAKAVSLIQDKEKYYLNPLFKDRVQLSYELLDARCGEEELLGHIKERVSGGKRILVEFIKKNTALKFYNRIMADEQFSCRVEYMSGDDSLMERSRILDRIKEEKGAFLLIATQVIEAGVDIDMDIGYKNISKLDSEEQFLGRINRSCMRTGKVYFFRLDDPKKIYGEDVRLQKEFTVENTDVRDWLEKKDFYEYYRRVLQVIKKNYNEQTGAGGLKDFFCRKAGKLYWRAVKERMRLIEEDHWSMSIYLARVLHTAEGEIIDGKELWEQYKRLLQDLQMNYAEKRVKLSEAASRMNGFIYQIRKNHDLIYNDRIGEIFYIDCGEKYFDNGKLNRQKLQGEVGEFVDFI